MKKRLLGILITTVILFSGCSGKSTGSTVTETKKDNTSTIVAEAKKDANSTEPVTVKTDFKPIKPGTVPQLSSEQKKQVNSKLNSAVKNIDDALNSIQDPNDINLDSVN